MGLARDSRDVDGAEYAKGCGLCSVSVKCASASSQARRLASTCIWGRRIKRKRTPLRADKPDTPQPRAFGWLPVVEMHAIAWSGWPYYAAACVWRGIRVRNARYCVQSGATPRIRVHLGGQPWAKRTPLRADKPDAPQPRAFGWLPVVEMHAIAWSGWPYYASACVWRGVRVRNARYCVQSGATPRIRVHLGHHPSTLSPQDAPIAPRSRLRARSMLHYHSCLRSKRACGIRRHANERRHA